MMEYQFATSNTRKLSQPSEENDLILRFSFKVGRSANRNWSVQVYKTVHQEYLTLDEITFVGLIGGMMGLFVGLSFFDIGSEIVEMLAKLIANIYRAYKQKTPKIHLI